MTLGEAIKTALLMTEFKREDFRENIFTHIADTAQKKIAFIIGGIKRIIEVNEEAERAVILGNDFYKPSPFFVRKYGENRYIPYHLKYDESGESCVEINEEGNFEIHYYAMPQTIKDDTPLNYEFEVPSYTHYAIPFYIAYEISKNDDTIIAQTALNEWLNILQSFKRQPKARNMAIENVYRGE